VIAALDVLEEDPTFDCGRGSFLNEHGHVELDAGIMEGKNLKAGAVAAMRNFLHPSRIARDVMEKTNHVFLVGEGAEQFALSYGYEQLPPEDLIDPRELIVFRQWIARGKPNAKIFFTSEEAKALREGRSIGAKPEERGTVGIVVALRTDASKAWELFAGTSTGGTPGKMRGRVGDVPVIGAGVYADNESCAVSCTGWGEGLLRIVAAQRVAAMVNAGLPL
jgi:L-asparaginase / beta-aspartyl-peptidase